MAILWLNEQSSVLISRDKISKRVEQLGRKITEDYQDKEPLMICTLRGSFMFFADLVRAINLPLTCGFISASSYSGTTRSGVSLSVSGRDTQMLTNQDIILVEDIVDTGHTMHTILDMVYAARPTSVKVATLLNKPSKCEVNVPLAYIGFDIKDVFVVGYGLDFNQVYRNLPDIHVLGKMGVAI